MALPYWIKSPLNTKLAIALIGVVFTSGVFMLLSTQYWMNRFHEESIQKLNASIAMYINDEYQLISDRENSVNLEAIKQLSQQAMIINPMVEAYLLDKSGNVIAHGQHQENIKHTRIELAPIQKFIAGNTKLPIYAQDPRADDQDKVFSATELRIEGELHGYLYVVLGSSLYEDITTLASKSYSASMLIVNISLISLLAVLCGVLIFRMILSRLHNLTHQICNFTKQHTKTVACDKAERDMQNTDEITVLTSTFEEMSDEISRQFQLLKESDQTRRELISNVSHDLRTPLASIQGYLETLIIKDNSLTEEQRQYYLNTAMSSSKRLSNLVGELFELSKLEAATTSPNVESFSLTELVYDTMQEFELELQNKGITWRLESPLENISVIADISLIQRVFENLVRNAIAHTPVSGEITFVLEQKAESQYQPIKVSIMDNGVGIGQEDLPHIFNRFYANADKSRKGTESNGLGLAIVKRILDLHDCPIRVESKLNQGTKFEFELPAAA